MSFFTQQTHVVQIDERNTITVRKPTNAERNLILDAIMPVANDENQVASKIMAMAPRMLITAWNGPDFDGRPVSSKNVDALPPQVIDATLPTLIPWVTEGLTPDLKKEFGVATN